MHTLMILECEKDGNFNIIRGIYKDFEDKVLNIPFSLTRIADIYKLDVFSSLSSQEENRIAKNILNQIEI